MFFLFSGEGPTDLGVCANNAMRCDGKDYMYGPMTVVVSQIVEKQHKYSLLETEHYGFVSEGALTDRASELKDAKKELGLPGKKRGKETRYFFNNARVFARIAIERKTKLNDEVVAVLFRDSDGTASAGRGLWDDKRQSILAGFEEEGFKKGVPMLPKPKSEAWILCAVKNCYVDCDTLENRSGNDNSPNSLKSELEKHLGNLPDSNTLCQMVEERKIDIEQIKMPSFVAFESNLKAVI
ncbi:MAG: hypothetical protein U9N87_15135 [Planctomycetota bacterium]|nr:hypothetical protein [Planctomycetota bacterium]